MVQRSKEHFAKLKAEHEIINKEQAAKTDNKMKTMPLAERGRIYTRPNGEQARALDSTLLFWEDEKTEGEWLVRMIDAYIAKLPKGYLAELIKRYG
jgi:hypothetical protein